jgi:pilus assembly protein Flp/PilA
MRTIMKISHAKTIALAKAKEGVTAIEYGLIAGFVALTIIAGIQLLGGNLQAFFQTMASQLEAAQSAGGGT